MRHYPNELRKKPGNLPWNSIDEVMNKHFEEQEFFAYPLFSPETVTVLSGPPKEAGKTTLLMAAIRAMLRGDPWLERDTVPQPVLYVTEQGERTFQIEAHRVGFRPGDSLPLYVVHKHDLFGLSWEQLVEKLDESVQVTGARVLVIDTFPDIVGWQGDEENQASAAGDKVRLLRNLAYRRHIAAVAVWHDSKAKNTSTVRAVRGSGAITGAVDTIIRVRRGETERQRRLSIESRIDAYPDLTIEPDKDWHYQVVKRGKPTDSSEIAAVLAAPQLSVREISKATGMARSKVHRIRTRYSGTTGTETPEQA